MSQSIIPTRNKRFVLVVRGQQGGQGIEKRTMIVIMDAEEGVDCASVVLNEKQHEQLREALS